MVYAASISRLWGNSIMWKPSFKFKQFQDDRDTVTKAHYMAGLRCTQQKLLFPLSLLSLELECDFTRFRQVLCYDNNESRLNDKKRGKISKDALTIRPSSRVKNLSCTEYAPVDPPFRKYIIYASIKSCLFYITFCFGI